MAIFRTFATGQTGVFNIPADASGVSATVNGSNASISFAAGVVTISPTPAAGDAVEITYTPTLAQPPGGGGGAAEVSSSTLVLPPSNWLIPEEKTPLLGTTVSSLYRGGYKGVRPFAKMDLAANVTLTGSGSPSKSDVARDDSPFGSTTLAINVPGFQTNIKVADTAVPYPSGIDVRNGFFRVLAQHASGTINANSISLELHASGSPGAPTANFISARAEPALNMMNTAVLAGIGFHPGDGNTLPAGWTLNGSATLADLQSIQWVRIALSGTSGAWVCHLGPIEWVPNARTKTAVVFSFDTVGTELWDTTLPMMAQYGFPGVAFPSPAATIIKPAGSVTGLTIGQLKALSEYHGWQIGSKAGATEDNGITAAYTDDEFLQDLMLVKSLWAGVGVHGIADGAYYSSIGTSSVGPTGTPRRTLMKKAHRSVRRYIGTPQASSGLGTGTPPIQNPETWPFADPLQWKSLNFTVNSDASDQARNLLRAQEHCEQADLAKGVAAFTVHGIGSYVGSFGQFLEWLDANRSTYDVITVDDLYNS